MEVKESFEDQKEKNKLKDVADKKINRMDMMPKTKKIMILGFICFILVMIILVLFSKEGNVEVKVKSSLDKLVEKSDLETVNFTYNVIAKKCKDEEKCDKKSNNIDDFEYVLSCKGTITSGIDFKNVNVKVDKKNKKLLVKMPEAVITDNNVISLKFLNGEDIPASELANARRLCEETIEEKSKKDDELLPAAREQAEVVLKSFYEQWLKAFDKDYKVEIK